MSYIYDTFKRSFNLVEANTPELRDIVYRLRYKVFCEQHGFLDASKYPDKMEKDEYDERSCHMLIQFIPTQEYVGTVRLILPDATDLEKTFPIENHTQIDPALCQVNKTIRKHIAEISRFLVVPSFNRRTDDIKKNKIQNQQQGSSKSVIPSTQNTVDRNKEKSSGRERRSGLNIYMVLMAGVVRMSRINQIEYWWCAMDPALNRLVGLSGMNIDPIGPVVDYNGLRQPHFGQICNVLSRLCQRNYGAWDVITDCGAYSYNETCTIKKL